MRNPLLCVLEVATGGSTIVPLTLKDQLEMILIILSSDVAVEFRCWNHDYRLILALIEEGLVEMCEESIHTTRFSKLDIKLTEAGKCLVHNLETGFY